jgi:hypothetical protein
MEPDMLDRIHTSMLDSVDPNTLFFDANPRAVIGGNNPPVDIFAQVRDACGRLGDFLKGHPALTAPADAKAANMLRDSVARTLADLEAERVAKVAPLNEQLAEINKRYKSVHNTDSKRPGTADKLLGQLKGRIATWLHAEEMRRQAIADAHRLAAEEAERIARAAEAAEKEAAENAALGDCDADVAAATITADQAFADYELMARAADRADRATHVKLTGGIGNAASLRQHEILEVADWRLAIEDLGLSEGIAAAILTAARAYRTANNELPSGITSRHERVL